MAWMLIEDSFPSPYGGVAVTGRPHDGDLTRGDQLWLTDGTTRHPVTIARVLHMCGRRPRDVAPAGLNAAFELTGAPPGLTLTGLRLLLGDTA
ncbi:hypothetical protein GCM10009827_113210 [Dactylosporangium maewongense]|uniref:Uncharacterized protein n=1 Tax=Dactylosporangium maewongense TaxID=634393 RepID=A0ABN2D9D3_9ACTN